MRYFIYREITLSDPEKSTYQQIGQTLFLADAEAILENWHSGYIIRDGNIVKSKNCVFDKN